MCPEDDRDALYGLLHPGYRQCCAVELDRVVTKRDGIAGVLSPYRGVRPVCKYVEEERRGTRRPSQHAQKSQ